MTAGKPKHRLAKGGKTLDPQDFLWENGKFPGKTMEKTTIFRMAETDGFICCETAPRPVAERESWELSCCPSGVQKIGIGKSGN